MTKEEIESLGWIHDGKAYGDYYVIRKRFDINDSTSYNEARLQVAPARLKSNSYIKVIAYEYSREHCDEETLFRGNIESVEELKVLMRQIGIL